MPSSDRFTLPQRAPAVNGWSGLPRSATARPSSSTSTRNPQASGQSSWHVPLTMRVAATTSSPPRRAGIGDLVRLADRLVNLPDRPSAVRQEADVPSADLHHVAVLEADRGAPLDHDEHLVVLLVRDGPLGELPEPALDLAVRRLVDDLVPDPRLSVEDLLDHRVQVHLGELGVLDVDRQVHRAR